MNTRHYPRAWLLIAAAPLVLATRTAGQQPARQTPPQDSRPRVVLTHDPELDDVNTMIAQQDFAARLKWSVTPAYKDANHAPVVKIDGPLARSVRAGQTIGLRGTVTDPDRDTVTVRWWHYQDAGTYTGEIAMPTATSPDATFRVPDDAQPGQTIHVILEATDSGTPPLTRYQRMVLTIQPSVQ